MCIDAYMGMCAGSIWSQADGLVLSGGCALNIKLNSRLSHEFKLPVHVPPAPCDAGLSAGATFAVHYKAALAPMAFKGLPVSDAMRAGMRGWMDANPRHKHGVHRYSLQQFGLDESALLDGLRDTVSEYQQTFGV